MHPRRDIRRVACFPALSEMTMTLQGKQLSKRSTGTWCSAPAMSMFAGSVVIKHLSIRNYDNDQGPPR